jgi:hypothetical protein
LNKTSEAILEFSKTIIVNSMDMEDHRRNGNILSEIEDIINWRMFKTFLNHGFTERGTT